MDFEEFKKDIPLHSFLIQLILLIVILCIYKFGRIQDKSMPICLLGSYILFNAGASYAHSNYHK